MRKTKSEPVDQSTVEKIVGVFDAEDVETIIKYLKEAVEHLKTSELENPKSKKVIAIINEGNEREYALSFAVLEKEEKPTVGNIFDKI